MTLTDLLERIWREPNRQMAWGRIPAGHVVDEKPAAPFAVGSDYVVVRLASMFLRDSRTLWLKLSPLAHATVELAGLRARRSDASVIGPAQFGDLAAASAERSVILFQRLSGPSVWRGGDLDLAAGLFAVPKDRVAVALLDTLAQLAGLGVPGLDKAGEIGRIVKGGVESLIGLDGTRPVLGVKVALKDPRDATPGTEASPCVLVGVAAPAREVGFARLWVREGRLWTGTSVDALTPFEKHDHLVISIERQSQRDDWPSLPQLLPHEAAFHAVLSDRTLTKEARKQRLSEAFSSFLADLLSEDDLSEPDKERVRTSVIADLRRRLRVLDDDFFGSESPTKSNTFDAGGSAFDPRSFDFLALTGDPASIGKDETLY